LNTAPAVHLRRSGVPKWSAWFAVICFGQMGVNELPKVNPFIDPEGYRAYVENRAQSFQETAQQQRK
jgi:hypothetical protein